MNHISTFLSKYQPRRAFYQGQQIISIQNYLASGRIHIVDGAGIDLVINPEELIII